MKNKIVVFLTATFLVIASFIYLNKNRSESDITSANFNLQYTFEIPDSLGPYLHIRSLLAVGDSLIFFSEQKTASFYRIDRHRNLIKRFTNIGSGPGEFQFPRNVVLHNNLLILSDAANPATNMFDLNGDFISSTRINGGFGLSNFFIYRSNYYRINGTASEYYFENVITGEKLIKTPRFFRKGAIFDSPRSFVYKNIIYFMNPYEAKIFRYDLDTKQELEHIALTYLPTYSWEMDEEISRKALLSRLIGFYYFPTFTNIIINNKLFFFLETVYDFNPKEQTGTVYKYILDQSGKQFKKFNLNGNILSSSNNKVITIDFDKEAGTFSLNEYSVN